MKIKIKAGNIEIEAELYDSYTDKKIYENLPIEGVVNRWGDEIYFDIPMHVELEADAKDILEKGDLGFWPSGDAFCIFFGKTPASQGDEIRAASKVNVFGKVIGDSDVLKQVKGGEKIFVLK